eukprot:3017028-Rhodomonas_salina.1
MLLRYAAMVCYYVRDRKGATVQVQGWYSGPYRSTHRLCHVRYSPTRTAVHRVLAGGTGLCLPAYAHARY